MTFDLQHVQSIQLFACQVFHPLHDLLIFRGANPSDIEHISIPPNTKEPWFRIGPYLVTLSLSNLGVPCSCYWRILGV